MNLAELNQQLAQAQAQAPDQISLINQQIERVKKHNESFRSYLLELLWNEIDFHLQMLVHKERKRRWFWQAAPAQAALDECNAQVTQAQAKSLCGFAKNISFSADRLAHDNPQYEAFKKQVTEFLNAADYSQEESTVVESVDSDPVDQVSSALPETSCMTDQYVTALGEQCRTLCETAREQERSLKQIFLQENSRAAVVISPQDRESFTRVSGDRSLSTENCERLQKLQTLANYPVLISDYNPVEQSENHAERLSEEEDFSVQIRREIVKRYRIEEPISDDEEQNRNAILRYLKRNGTTRYWLWPGEEYKSIYKILAIAAKPKKDINDFAEAQISIDYLSQKYPDQFVELNKMFRTERFETCLPDIRQVSPEKKRDSESVDALDIPNLNNANEFSSRVQTDRPVTIVSNRLPDRTQDLKTLACFIVNKSSGESLDLQEQKYTSLLKAVESLSSSKSLYFSVFIVGLMLMTLDTLDQAYEIFSNLLSNIINRKYDSTIQNTRKRLFDAGFSAITSWFPNTIDIPSTVDFNPVKEALLPQQPQAGVSTEEKRSEVRVATNPCSKFSHPVGGPKNSGSNSNNNVKRIVRGKAT